MAAERFSLKDALFNAESVGRLAAYLRDADPDFPASRFVADVIEPFGRLELKARIAHIADVLARYLPHDFPRAADVIERALPPPLDPTKTDNDFGEFIIAPFGDYAVSHGLEAHPRRALDLIEALTQRFSMEGAIRPFLSRRPEETLARLDRWAGHPNYHVRRLVSEGTRPLLPWAPRIRLAPGRVMPLLDRLYADSTRYVTRSVANHLNDITKSDPELALSALSRWRDEGRQEAGEFAWMARHALRTLVKSGHDGALEFLGYSRTAPVRAISLDLERDHVAPGGAVVFSVSLLSDTDTPAVIDYGIDFARPDGKRARKVFKLATTTLTAGQALTFGKRRVLKGDATTYRLHPGRHVLSIQVNGKVVAEAAFEVTAF
jgi:3-methyladenine DNA glycosylase AlkC